MDVKPIIDFFQGWPRFMRSHARKVFLKMTYPEYAARYGKGSKTQVAVGLTFGAYVMTKLGECSLNTRIEVLKMFVKDSNPFVRIIAMMESLPTSVWRRLLWKENIDFSSPECFLRRLQLEKDKISKIEKCYEEYMCGEVPSVMSKIKKWFNIITIEKLQAEELNPGLRYKTKLSWSYNIGLLDIGFNAYPRGENDDTHVVEKDPRRLVQVKNHICDFEVNREFGKYHWLYKTARSNPGYNPNKEIQLKKNFCPGMWETFIIHILFWIASPIALATVVVYWHLHVMPPWLLVPVIVLLGAFIPLWLVSAIVRKIFGFIRRVIPRLDRNLDNWATKHAEEIKKFQSNMVLAFKGLVTLMAVCVFLAVLSVIFFIWRFVLGSVGSGAICLMIFAYFGYRLYFLVKNNYYCSLAEHPWQLKRLYEIALLIAIVCFVEINQVKIIALLKILWHWASLVMPTCIPIFFLSLIPIIILLVHNRQEKKYRDQKDYKKWERLTEKTMKVFSYYILACFLVMIIMFAKSIHMMRGDNQTTSMILPISIMCLTVVFFLLVSFISAAFSDRNNYISDIEKKTVEPYGFSGRSTIPQGKTLFKLILKNDYLQAMDIRSRNAILHGAFGFVHHNLRTGEEGPALKKLIPVLRKDTIDGLKECYKKAEDDIYKAGFHSLERINRNNNRTFEYRLFLMINEGMTYQEAIAQIIAEEYMRRFRERKSNNEEAKKLAAKAECAQTVAKPFHAIGAVVMAIINAVISFKRFSIDVMAQMCPHITESKVFTINLEDE